MESLVILLSVVVILLGITIFIQRKKIVKLKFDNIECESNYKEYAKTHCYTNKVVDNLTKTVESLTESVNNKNKIIKDLQSKLSNTTSANAKSDTELIPKRKRNRRTT